MKINKEFILHNLITICCALALIMLFLPFISINSSVSSSFVSNSDTQLISAFSAITDGSAVLSGIILIVGPILLIVMNYIKQLEKYRGLLAIGIPVLCIIDTIIDFFIIKGAAAGAGAAANAVGSIGGVSANISAVPHVGFYFMLIVYIGTIVAGAVTYHGLKLSKDGIKDFKLNTDALGNIKGDLSGLGDKISNTATNIAGSVKEGAENIGSKVENHDLPSMDQLKPNNITSSRNINKADDTLELISKLAKMKDDGILTEEEFQKKKKELLEEI